MVFSSLGLAHLEFFNRILQNTIGGIVSTGLGIKKNVKENLEKIRSEITKLKNFESSKSFEKLKVEVHHLTEEFFKFEKQIENSAKQQLASVESLARKRVGQIEKKLTYILKQIQVVQGQMDREVRQIFKSIKATRSDALKSVVEIKKKASQQKKKVKKVLKKKTQVTRKSLKKMKSQAEKKIKKIKKKVVTKRQKKLRSKTQANKKMKKKTSSPGTGRKLRSNGAAGEKI